MNLSFAGCGFLGIYHVGVAVCFKKYAPHLLLHKISGASAGALAACCLLCDLPLGEMTSDFFRVVNEARSHSLGPFSPSFSIQTCLLAGLQKFLPVDAHERVNGKLHISLTRVYDGKNVIVSQFNSREDLLQALLCACFIPVFSGLLPPRFHGVRYMDGAFSDNLPTLDENTVTVSPFCGESDICPRDNSSQMFHVNWANTSIEISKQNINRFGRVLFPPKPEVLSNMCQQGFDDALSFLHRNNLISCTRCLAVQSTFVVAENIVDPIEQQDYDPECKECNEHRKEALVGNLPDTVLTVFEKYIEQANKGLINWIFRHRSAKLITALSIPAILPVDMVCATLTKLLLTTNRFASIVGESIEKKDYSLKVLLNIIGTKSHTRQYKYGMRAEDVEHDLRRIMINAPTLGNQLWTISKYILDNLNTILMKTKPKTQKTANISCKLALTEYGLPIEPVPTTTATAATTNVAKKTSLSHAHNQHYHRESKVDIFEDENIPNATDLFGSSVPVEDVDTFENILEVTSHQEAVYAYYYMDENHKVKVTEIFDMSESDNPALQTVNERELNQQLEFDSDWEATQPDYLCTDSSDSYFGSNMIEYDDDDRESNDSWKQHATEINIDDTLSDEPGSYCQYLKPEADQTDFLSESATDALNRPAPSSYSIFQFE